MKMINFYEVLDERKKFPIYPGAKDALIEDLINNNYNDKFCLVSIGALNNNIDKLNNKYYIDIIVKISSPFLNVSIPFYIIHLTNKKGEKVLTGIYESRIYEKGNKKVSNNFGYWLSADEYTEAFLKFIDEINEYIDGKKINRKEINVVDFDMFDRERLNPLLYTKEAINIANEIKNENYILLSDIANIISTPTDLNIKEKCLDSTNFIYPIDIKKIEVKEIQKSIKVKKWDIIALLIGEKTKFYLINEDVENIYVKLSNYVVIRCKDQKMSYYLYTYLNDDKAQLYINSIKTGSIIPHVRISDLKNTKVIMPTEEMINNSKLSFEYLNNYKKLTLENVNDLIRKSNLSNFELESQKMINKDIIDSISYLKCTVLIELIKDDLKELEICYENGAYKSAIILCGSILEAILLDWLSEYELADNITDVGKKDDGFHDLELSMIIKKLREYIKPYWYEYKEAHEIRKTRNLVHPKECIRNNIKVDKELCKDIINDLNEILDSRKKRND